MATQRPIYMIVVRLLLACTTSEINRLLWYLQKIYLNLRPFDTIEIVEARTAKIAVLVAKFPRPWYSPKWEASCDNFYIRITSWDESVQCFIRKGPRRNFHIWAEPYAMALGKRLLLTEEYSKHAVLLYDWTWLGPIYIRSSGRIHSRYSGRDVTFLGGKM